MSPEVSERALALRREGLGRPQIAEELGVSVTALSRVFRARGVAKPGCRAVPRAPSPWSAELVDRVQELYASGETKEDMASLLGTTRDAVRGIVRRHGFKRSADPRQSWTPERIEEVRVMWEAGDSGGVIAQRLGITREAAIGVVSRYRIKRRPGMTIETISGPRIAGGAKPPPKPKRVKIAREPRLRAPDGRQLPMDPTRVMAAIQPPSSEGPTLIELQPHSCKWPVGERGGQHVFCGSSSAGVYCADHSRAARRRAA